MKNPILFLTAVLFLTGCSVQRHRQQTDSDSSAYLAKSEIASSRNNTSINVCERISERIDTTVTVAGWKIRGRIAGNTIPLPGGGFVEFTSNKSDSFLINIPDKTMSVRYSRQTERQVKFDGKSESRMQSKIIRADRLMKKTESFEKIVSNSFRWRWWLLIPGLLALVVFVLSFKRIFRSG